MVTIGKKKKKEYILHTCMYMHAHACTYKHVQAHKQGSLGFAAYPLTRSLVWGIIDL